MQGSSSPSSQLSLAKDKIRFLLLEGVSETAVDMMKAAGYSSIERLPKALDGAALLEAIKGVHVLGIRSRTQIDAAVLEAADRLIAIGCFNVGTNQVDIDAARRLGVPVFNAPFSNTRSVAELVIGEIVMLLRRIIPRSVAAHAGRWDKSADDSHEVRGKTLGIVGYGNIGSQLSYLAEAHGDAGHLLRSHRQAPPRQYRADREPEGTARAERRREPACAGDAGDSRHDRRRRDRGDEAGRLSHQQQPRHRRRSRRARGKRCAPGGCAAPRSTSSPSSPAPTRSVSSRRCRGWTMSS